LALEDVIREGSWLLVISLRSTEEKIGT